MKNTQKNVSDNEITKFNELAKHWWDPHGPMRPLHQLNPLRLAFIEKHSSLQNKTVLDVGCGAGILSEALAQKGAHVTGIDMSPDVLAAAKDHAHTHYPHLQYKEITIEAQAALTPDYFDSISCMEMLEHVPDPLSVIKACALSAKPGAKIFFSTINRNIKSFLKAIVGAEYILNLLPKGTHDYAKFIRPSELDAWARAAGLHLIELKGMEYSPFTNTFSITDNVSVNYLCCYQKELYSEH